MWLFLLACVPEGAVIAPDAAAGRSDLAPSVVEPVTDPGVDLPDERDPDPETEDEPAPEPGACPSFESATLVGTLPVELDEVSGLAASRTNPGVLWALEDSGNRPEVYALDLDGTLLATVRLPVPNVDWEDLAIAPCGEADCLWIADVGDNNLVRSDSTLYVIREPALEDGTATGVQTIPVRYAAGPHNVEALVVDDAGEPVLFSKRDDGTTEILRESGNQFQSVGELTVAAPGDDAWTSRLTAADLWPDDRTLLLRTYGTAWRYDLTEGGLASLPQATRQAISAPAQPQVEAVAWDPTIGGWWQTSEGVGAALYFTGCSE